jgi:predicted negative regulator of RcsB-dependent stress response
MKHLTYPIAFLAAAAFAAGACAQQQTTKDGKRVGTRDEYRACLDGNETIAKRRTELEERGAKRKKEAEELQAATQELNADIKKLDDESLTGIARTRLERKVKEQQNRIKAAQDSDVGYNADIAAYEQSVADYRGKCTNVAFDNDDVAAVKKEREAAGKK